MNSKIQKMLLTMSVVFVPAMAFAVKDVGGEASAAISTTFNFANWFNLIAAAGGVIFLVILVIGGIMYITAAGNEEASTKAKKLLVDSIIGIVVIGIAWSFGGWLLNLLGVTGINKLF